MADTILKRSDKPEWFALVDRVKAIREVKAATYQQLADYLGVTQQRLTEWFGLKREARAEKVLEIQRWVNEREEEMELTTRIDYRKIVKRLKRNG
jgi:transcriptional regulator with XRE-family HTH domain